MRSLFLFSFLIVLLFTAGFSQGWFGKSSFFWKHPQPVCVAPLPAGAIAQNVDGSLVYSSCEVSLYRSTKIDVFTSSKPLALPSSIIQGVI